MVPFYNKDERVKIGIFIVIALVIQGCIFAVIYSKSINNINRNIINQNYSLIGSIAEKDQALAKEIIPIVTNNQLRNIDEGRDILSNYSYNYNLPYYNNPLLKDTSLGAMLWGVAVLLITASAVLLGIFTLLNPLYKKIRFLTYRAENIIEDKEIDDNHKDSYRGSLDKFTLKFNQMENRIKNSLDLLQSEKINLKNIINDISHQLKTPLMALQMYNEILKDYDNMDDEDINNFISLSAEQLGRMEWLVKTLLKYARLESNVVEYHKEEISLNNTIGESINPLIIKAKEKHQVLIFKESKEIVFNHDRKWIAEALSNIIKNAIEHTEEGGTIEIGVEETPITINIWVKDNGEGIEQSEIKKIFNRFHKGENSINPTSIGIGLCLSKAIVKAHNGDITVESKVGEGSKFYITFIKTT